MNNAEQHMSNERTFLAWIRTGIGIMVFGFVTVKFSLFINQLPAKFLHETAVPKNGHSTLIGIALVITGALTILMSYWHYRRTYRQLQNEQYVYSTFLVTLLTAVIFSMSILLIAYLVLAAYPLS
jgi:putative membrane protein